MQSVLTRRKNAITVDGRCFFNQEDIMSKELAKTYDPKGLEDRLYQKWIDNGSKIR